MKVKMDLGFAGFEELKEKIEKIGVPLPVDLEYVKKYEKDWRTAYISKDEQFVIKSIDDIILASFSSKTIHSGNFESHLKKGNEYIFGRETSFSLLQDLYCVSIKPNGEYDKKTTGVRVTPSVSRVHYYVRDLDDEIEIARLGMNPINIEFSKYKSNIWL